MEGVFHRVLFFILSTFFALLAGCSVAFPFGSALFLLRVFFFFCFGILMAFAGFCFQFFQNRVKKKSLCFVFVFFDRGRGSRGKDRVFHSRRGSKNLNRSSTLSPVESGGT